MIPELSTHHLCEVNEKKFSIRINPLNSLIIKLEH